MELDAGWDRPLPKTGAPAGIDKGWAYAPGRSVAGDVQGLRDKLPGLPAEIGAALAAMWPASARKRLADEFSEFVDRSLDEHGRGHIMVVGGFRRHWVEGAKAHGVRPQTAEIAIRDKDIKHALRDAKSGRVLDLDWFRRLPHHLLHPDAVILDVTHEEGPSFLLLFKPSSDAPKVVIRINYRVKKAKEAMNLIVTGQRIDARNLIGQPGYIWIEGAPADWGRT